MSIITKKNLAAAMVAFLMVASLATSSSWDINPRLNSNAIIADKQADEEFQHHIDDEYRLVEEQVKALEAIYAQMNDEEKMQAVVMEPE